MYAYYQLANFCLLWLDPFESGLEPVIATEAPACVRGHVIDGVPYLGTIFIK